jgi:hypothetical protein
MRISQRNSSIIRLDATHDYMHLLVSNSAARLKTVERLSVFGIGLVGQDEALQQTVSWCREEDKAIVDAMEGPCGLREKVNEAADSLARVHNAFDTRLQYIDECAAKLARERYARRDGVIWVDFWLMLLLFLRC